MANLVLNGKSIDTREEIAENFIIDEVLAAVCDGTLVSWLDEFDYDKELSRMRSIPVGLDNDGIVSQIIGALGLSKEECLAANERNMTKKSACARDMHACKAREEQQRKDEAVYRYSECIESREPANTRKTESGGGNNQSVEKRHVMDVCETHGVEDFDVVTDFDSAFKIYKRSAELGDATAQRYLAYCYFLGKGVVESNEMGIYWTQKSAEAGDIMAQHLLVRCYESKIWIDGGEDDYSPSKHWNDKLRANPDYDNPDYKIFDNTNRRHIAGENGFWSVLEKGAKELYYSGKSLLANCRSPINDAARDMFTRCISMRDLRYGKYASYQVARTLWVFPYKDEYKGPNKYADVCFYLKEARDSGCHEAENILTMLQEWTKREHQKYGRVDWDELFRVIDCPDVSV